MTTNDPSSSSIEIPPGENDWEKYFCKHRGLCWTSKSRNVTYRGASRRNKKIVKAGWVVLPSVKDQDAKTQKCYNVFSEMLVNDIREIPQSGDAAKPGRESKESARRSNHHGEGEGMNNDSKKMAASHHNKNPPRNRGEDNGRWSRSNNHDREINNHQNNHHQRNRGEDNSSGRREWSRSNNHDREGINESKKSYTHNQNYHQRSNRGEERERKEWSRSNNYESRNMASHRNNHQRNRGEDRERKEWSRPNNHREGMNHQNNPQRYRGEDNRERKEWPRSNHHREGTNNDSKKTDTCQNNTQRHQKDNGTCSMAKMRALHKWVNTVLIDSKLSSLQSTSNSSVVSVLELACGKGENYIQFQTSCPPNSHLNYVGVDMARDSLKEFIAHRIVIDQKPNEAGRVGASSTNVRLVCANIGTHPLVNDDAAELDCWNDETCTWTTTTTNEAFDPPQTTTRFDLVSMPHAFPSMCQNSDKLADFFRSWSSNLKDGGCFVTTCMDSNVIREYYLGNKSDNDKGSTSSSSSSADIVICDQNDKPHCRIIFEDDTRAILLDGDDDEWNMTLGINYNMELTEYDYSVDDDDDNKGSEITTTEWIVPMASLIHHAWKYGNLYLVHEDSCSSNYTHFIQTNTTRKSSKYRNLLQQMNVFHHSNDRFTNMEFTLAKLYRTLVFQKGAGRRVAIIVPYRDEHVEQQRSNHLSQFIPYMIKYMSNTNVPFHIFIVEQSSNDGRKFNRGKLLNAGYQIAKERKCDAFIFHDVDLLPNDKLRIHYRCTDPKLQTVPNHIARVWSRYSNNQNYIGGVTAFSSECFEKLNGFPNNFWGWGGEDDELRNRLSSAQMRFSSPNKSGGGSLRDLEQLSLKEKLNLMRKQNTDREGSDNKWKCMVKHELLKEHGRTWCNNGLYYTNQDGREVETELYSSSEEYVYPSGFASKITVELRMNNDRWDTVTSWKDL